MAAVALKISGPEGERRVSVNGSVKLGRGGGCDVVLKHPSVSDQALLVRRDGGGAIAEPLGGVIALNDARMQSKRQLSDGDEIKLGPYRIRVAVTGSLSVRPPSVRPGSLTPATNSPGARPSVLPLGNAVPMRASAPPPEPTQISEGARQQALTDARARLVRGEKRSIVLSKLGEAGIARGEATAHIEDVISGLRAGTRRRAVRRVLLGALALLLGSLATTYYAEFIPRGIGRWLLALGLPHTERTFLFAGEQWAGPALAAFGLLMTVAGAFRILRGDPRYEKL